MAPLALILDAAGLVVVDLSRLKPIIRAIRSRTTAVAGTVVLAAVTLLALPGFVSAIIDIAGEA